MNTETMTPEQASLSYAAATAKRALCANTDLATFNVLQSVLVKVGNLPIGVAQLDEEKMTIVVDEQYVKDCTDIETLFNVVTHELKHFLHWVARRGDHTVAQ